MNTPIFTKKLGLALLTGLVLAATLPGCSDDDAEKVAAKPVKEVFNPFDHSQDVPVTNAEKHKFEDAFAAQCLKRELKNSVNPDIDKERFGKTCACVANYMIKDLTDEEVEKYLGEHENPRSLQIKYNAAVYHCTQPKNLEKGFKSFTPNEPAKKEGFFSKLF